MNCAGIDLNPQVQSNGLSAVAQIIVEAAENIKAAFKVGALVIKTKKTPEQKIKFIRERLNKSIYGNSSLDEHIPDNTDPSTLSSEDKVKLSNLQGVMKALLSEKAIPLFDGDTQQAKDFREALFQVLAIEVGQDNNIKTDTIEPASTAETEEAVQTDTIDDSTRLVLDQLGMSPSDFKKAVYVGATELDSFRKARLKQQIASNIVRNGIYLNDDAWVLNSQIVAMKNKWFETICNYLGEAHEKLFTQSKNTNKFTYYHRASGVLNRFKIKALKGDTSVRTDEAFQEAVGAFVNLISFDSELKDYMGKDISVNRYSNTSFSDKNLPYGISSHNSLRSGWTTEELSDGMKNIPHMTKLLFNTIPEYKGGRETGMFLEDLSTIVNVKRLLVKCLQSSNITASLKNELRTLRISGNAKEVLHGMFGGDADRTKAVEGVLNSMSAKEQVILRSFFRALYGENGNGGLYGEEAAMSRNNNKATILDALIHAVTQVDMMAYQSVDLKEDYEGTSATQYLRSSNKSDNETLDLASVINQVPFNDTDNKIVAYDDHWELAINNHWLISITPAEKSKYGYTTTNNNQLEIKITRDGIDVTSNFLNQDTGDSSAADFNNHALTSDNQIIPEYKDILDFIVKELKLKTTNEESLNELLGTMQGEFTSGKYSGFSGALISAIRSQIVKHIVQNYNEDNTDLNIQSYYNKTLNKSLPNKYTKVPILSSKTIIAGTAYGIGYKIVGAQRDPWMNAYGSAKQILEGTNVSSTTTSSDNKKQPTVRQFAYGLNPRERIREQLNAEGEGISRNVSNATTSLLFSHNISSGNADLLAETAAHVDLEVTDTQGNTKQIKNMNVNEMTHHAIFDNFYNHFWDKGELTFQPMDYSDKGIQIVYTSRGTVKMVIDNGENVDIQHATPQQIQQLYRQTIGGYYRKSLRNTLIDISNSINRTKYSSFPVSTDPNDNALLHINYHSTQEEVLAAAKAIDKWMQEVPTEDTIKIGDSVISTQSIYQQYLINPNAVYIKANIKGTGSNEVLNPEGVAYTNAELYTMIKNKGLTEQQLTDQSFAAGITLYSNMSYALNNKKVRLNPALVYMGTLQFNEENLASRWERDKAFFVNDLLLHNCSFRVSHTYTSEYGEDTIKTTDVDRVMNDFFNDANLKSWRQAGDTYWNKGHWVKGDYMIIAKIKHADNSITDLIFQSELQLSEGDTLILNPLLDHYFQTDNLLSNNMRFTMIGSEFSDPLKMKDFSMAFNDSYINKRIAEHPELTEKLTALRGTNNFDSLIQNIEDVNPLQFELIESNLWNTSNKRSNIVTATLTPFQLGTKQGVSRNVNIAHIEDLKASVYNFFGMADKDIDAMDGATFTDGIQATWESWSMPGQTIGMDKKTIAHGYDNRTGGTILLKHAQYAINNERMVMARTSQIDLERVFKKMNNWKFDTIKWGTLTPTTLKSTRFENLYHQVDDGRWRKIRSFSYDTIKGAYYTLESMVDDKYQEVPNTCKEYYYKFDPITQELVGDGDIEGAETVNSIYELWQALGGMDTFELQNGALIRSEGSQVGSAMVINNSITTDDKGKEYQPFKTHKIHYLANNSASKRIQGNINSRDSWFNDTPFKHSKMTMTRFGSQLDADHEVEDSSITLPTQAMAALVQGGVNQEYAREVYTIMGSLALETSKLNSDLVYDFMKSYNAGEDLSQDQIQRFHETIGHLLAVNYSKQNDAELGDIILQSMSKILRRGTAELKQNFKIPFSDSALYSSLMPVITSAINNVSIKAKLAGNALVLTPGYKIAQYLNYGEINADGVYDDSVKTSRMAQDVYNEAKDAYNNNETAKAYIDNYLAVGKQVLNVNNYSIRQKQLIQGYLHYLQDVHERTSAPKQAGEFLPNEVVRVKYTLPNGKEIAQDIRFDFNIEDYYNFVDAYDSNNLANYLRSKGIAVDANATNFRLYDSIISPRDLAPLRYSFEYTDKDGKLRKSNIYLLDGIRRNLDNAKLRGQEFRQALISLDNGKATIGNNEYTISNVVKQAAEEIAPNAYAEKYDVKGKTLLEARKILSERLSDPNKIKTNFGVPYLCAFTLTNNRHTIVSMVAPPDSSDHAVFQELDPEQNTIIKQEDGKDWVYKMDKDRQLLYKVGIRDGGEITYFVKPYKLETVAKNGNVNSYQYFYIDAKALREHNIDTNLIVPEVIRNMYEINDYVGVEVSPYITKQYKQNTRDPYYEWLSNAFEGYDVNDFISQQFRTDDLAGIRANWYNIKQKQILASFEKTLETMVTRIPTATKQSFMAMRIVGFTGGTDNRIYVSHFQAWLQGSDYDIDKGYQLGYNFDSNGIFTGWSKLFDYSTKDTLEASCNLPIPKHTTWRMVNSDEDVDLFNMNINGQPLINQINNLYDNKGALISIIERNKLVGAFLRKLRLSNGQVVKVKYNINDIKQRAFINSVIQHESTNLTDGKKIKAYQNALSWNSQHIINDIKEVADSYVPTSVDNMHTAVDELQLSGDSGRYNMMNPLNKYILIYTNLTGKNVISVAANVQKSYFNLYNYFQDVIRYPKDYNPKYYKFVKQFSRIQEHNGHKETVTKSTLGNLNFDAIPEFGSLSKLLFMTDPKIKEQLLAIQRKKYINNDAFTQDFIKAYRYSNITPTFAEFLNLANDVLNKYNPDQETLAKYGNTYMLLNSAENPESSISELLNAAADNAKELILSKINAGMNLAGVHGYLMSMGFNLKDIIRFMTSTATNVLNTLTQEDIYNKTYYKSRKADALLNNVLLVKANQDYWQKVLMNPTIISATSDSIEDIVARQLLKNVYNELKGYHKDIELNPVTGRVTYKGQSYDSLTKLQGKEGLTEKDLTLINSVIGHIVESFDNFVKDTVELANVYRGTKEMTAMSQLFLSLNQGISSTQSDGLYFESRVYKFIKSMEEVLPDYETIRNDIDKYRATGVKPKSLSTALEKIKSLRAELTEDQIINDIYECQQAGIYKNFNYKNYLLDSEVSYLNYYNAKRTVSYRDLATKYYNLMKDSFNMFDIMQHSPQYSQYLDRFRDAVVSSDTASAKSVLIRYFFDELREQDIYMSDNLIKQIQSYIDDAYIQKYLNGLNFQFRVSASEKNGNKFDKLRLVRLSADETINLQNSDNIATFKYWVENQLLPQLQSGYYMPLQGDSAVSLGKPNAFALGLRNLIQKGRPYLTLDIDMTNTSNSTTTMQKYSQYLQGFRELEACPYGEGSLQDVFMLYNLLVNGTRYGRHRITSIFQERLQQDQNNLENPEYKQSALSQWYAFQGQQDFNNVPKTIEAHQLETNPNYRNQILKQYGLSVMGFLKYSAPFVSNPRESMAPVVKMVDSTTLLPYYYNKNGKKGNKELDFVEGVTNSNVSSKEQQSLLDNLIKYYPTIVDESIIRDSYKIMFSDPGAAENGIYTMTNSGALKILINCV